MKFTMMTDKGKKLNVKAQFSSFDDIFALPEADVKEYFIKIIKKAEESFLGGYMEKLAKKGKPGSETVEKLKLMYSEHKNLIKEN